MTWGAPAWIWPAVALGVAALAAILWSYRRGRVSLGLRATASTFKLAGILLLLFCLTEPLVRRVRARPGANQLLVLVDDSRSLSIRDRGDPGGDEGTRAEDVRDLLREDGKWLLRAGQDFDLRRFAFASRLRSLESPDELSFDGSESSLARALERLAARSAGRPVAGILLVTDGIATDRFPDDYDWSALPPVHAVVVGGEPARDLALSRLEVTQTNFEETPVTIRADVRAVDCAGESIAVELRDEQGDVLERQVLTAADDVALEVRFDAPTRAPGVHFFSVRVAFAEPKNTMEATAANNERWAVVDRGAGAFRVLYVSGRPNWEFKFLNRALEEDAEIELVGLLRIARSQPRFSFREGSDRRNALWGGFDNRDEEVGEQYDEPVLLRTAGDPQLKGGFPTKADDLFGYDGLVLDDLEAGFFTPDQQALIEQFVSRRGAGLLVLGGEQSYLKGGYRRTPLGDLLPVYLDVRMADGPLPERRRRDGGYSLELTREGWLEPWVRLRSTEAQEVERLAGMPPFRTVNRVGEVKPGGVVLIEARDATGAARPALVAHRFGRGRSAAMMVGDLWRWDLQRPDPEISDLGTAWRQLLRWLVADVPRRVELNVSQGERSREVELTATLRDAAFEAVHNARVSIEIVPPPDEYGEHGEHGEAFELDASPSPTSAGSWVASFVPRTSGPYRARLHARGEDQAELGRAEAGWVSEPATDEFRSLDPDRELLADVARRTGGSVLAPAELAGFVADLARQEVPITEEELDPIWHRWWVFFLALTCFCVEWGIRRFQGMP